jgi:hypothetical protein
LNSTETRFARGRCLLAACDREGTADGTNAPPQGLAQNLDHLLAELTNELSSTALSKSAATDAGRNERHEADTRSWRNDLQRLQSPVVTAASAVRSPSLLPEGADVLISYLEEHNDAHETERLVKEAGTMAVLAPADLKQPDHCRAVIAKAVSELGGIDILVNNAAHQATLKSIEDISDEEWELAVTGGKPFL